MKKINYKTKAAAHRKWSSRIGMLGAVAVFATATVAQMFQPAIVEARDFDAEIKNLQKQVDSYNAQASEKNAQANTLQGKIDELKAQQRAIQAQINLSSAKRESLEQQIADSAAKLKNQAQALRQNLQDQYYGGNTTSLDILMNSSSVSDYVDRQTRQSAITDGIKKTVARVRELKAQQESDKKQVENVIAQQQSQKDQLKDNQAQQQELLNQTRGDEAKFQELSKKTEQQKAQVQKEQQAAIQAYIAEQRRRATSRQGSSASSQKPDITISVGGKNGGYPFANARADSTQYYKGFTANGNARECVNYVQWRIWQLTGRMERHGNGGQWPKNLGKNPKVGSVAVKSNFGVYGHVAWVEEIGSGSRSGMVRVSEYNWDPAYGYNERWVATSWWSGFYKNW